MRTDSRDALANAVPAPVCSSVPVTVSRWPCPVPVGRLVCNLIRAPGVLQGFYCLPFFAFSACHLLPVLPSFHASVNLPLTCAFPFPFPFLFFFFPASIPVPDFAIEFLLHTPCGVPCCLPFSTILDLAKRACIIYIFAYHPVRLSLHVSTVNHAWDFYANSTASITALD